MAMWLLKTEPDCYCWDDLIRDGKTVWDGVSNALARKHIRAIRKGDQLLIYHTGKEKSVMGVGEAAGDAYPDPRQHDDKASVFDLKPRRALNRPVSLAEIKADPAFAQWELVRMSRLSVMPVPARVWEKIELLASR